MKKYNIYHKKLPFWINPEKVFASLYGNKEESFWLDTNKTDESSQFSYMGDTSGSLSQKISYTVSDNKLTVQTKKAKKQYTEDIFSYLKKQLTGISNKISLPFGFTGGYVGYFGYELKALLGSKNNNFSKCPDSMWYFIDRFIAFDHIKKQIYLVCLSDRKEKSEEWFAKIELRIENYELREGDSRKEKKVKFRLTRSKEQYLKDIETCKKYLTDGESYQLCLTNTITGTYEADPFLAYLRLRKINPAPYGAYIRFEDMSILCASPEKFLTIQKDKTVTSKPIKGTIQRGRNAKEDKYFEKSLSENKKEQAENTMIVDLVRNDLGRVCEIGSVHVPKLMAVERYATVHQLVSTVTGRLQNNADCIDCIKACFPGGSMTGAPKLRTMKILENIENEARGIYSGSLGYISTTGVTDLNIVIRTIILQKNKFSIGIGGGVLYDSNPQKEFEETMLKAKASLYALQNN